MPGDVKVDLKPLERFRALIKNDSTWHKIGKQWAARYRGFVQERYDRYSKGGGNWPPLKPSTIARRRKRSSVILRDKGILFAAVTPEFTGQPGAIEENIPFGVRVGYGGSAIHAGTRTTIADIASFHQEGGPNLPKREIIVQPDDKTFTGMVSDAQRAVNAL